MTLESFNKARDIVIKIRLLDAAIADLKDIMRNDTSEWIIEVRPNASHPPKKVDHDGLLTEFLQAVLSKYIEKLHKLQSELDEL